MIKKLFLCAALVGAVGLTSCVDDVESASVVAVREGKAAEIKAAANLQKANAQAEAIMAAAAQAAQQGQAALDQANIEYAQSQAAVKRAEAAYQNALTAALQATSEQEQALAAVQLEQARVELEKELQILEQFKIDVEAQKAKLAADLAAYEAKIAEYLYETQKSKDDLDKMIAGKEQAVYARLQRLVAEYNKQSDKLLALQKRLFNQNARLAKFEAGITQQYPTTVAEIQELEDENNSLTQEIANARTYISTIKTTDYADAEAKLPTLQEEAKALTAAKNAAYKAWDPTAKNNLISARNILYKSDYMDAVGALVGFKLDDNYEEVFSEPSQADIQQGYVYYPNTNMIPYLKIELALDNSDITNPDYFNMYCVTVKTQDLKGNIKTEVIPLLSNNTPAGTKTLKEVTIGDDGNKWYESATYNIYNPDAFYSVQAGAPAKYSAILTQNIKNLNDSIKKATKIIADANDSIANLKVYKADFDKADKAVADLEAPAPDAAQDVIDKYNADKKVLEDAKKEKEDILLEHMKYADEAYATVGAYDAAVNHYKFIVSTYTPIRNQLQNAYLPQAEDYNKKINGYLAALGDGSDMTSLVNALNDADKNVAEAYMAYQAAITKENIKNAELAACQDIIENTRFEGDVTKTLKEVIAEKEQEINDAEATFEANETTIKSLTESLTSLKFDDEALINDIKSKIAWLELKIEAKKYVVDAAKAALDAALAEDAPAEK